MNILFQPVLEKENNNHNTFGAYKKPFLLIK